ncbi:hypothetical protein UPYG_G00143800, partial [Umbra pygmaea]
VVRKHTQSFTKKENYTNRKHLQSYHLLLSVQFYFLLHFRSIMVSQGCLGFIKYFLFLFNLLFCCLGALLLSLGVWIVFAERSFFMTAPPYMSFSLLSYFLVVGGSVTMLLGFIGCLGALKEVKCMLGMYFFFLSILLAAQIVGAVLLYTQSNTFESQVEEHVLFLIGSFGRNESSYQNFEKTLDYVQQEIHCCGWIGPQNWVKTPCSCYHPNNITDILLASNHTESCDCQAIQNLSLPTMCEIYKNGCKDSIRQWMENNILIMFGMLLAVVTVELYGMTLSMCLYRQTSLDYSIPLYQQ